MKKAKKFIIPIFLAAAILISSLTALYFTSIESLMPKSKNVIVVQSSEDSGTKEILLNENDSKEIIRLLRSAKDIPFNSFIDFLSIPACMFDEEFSLKIGNKTYCISIDDCNMVECNSCYFDITPSAKAEIYDIIHKAVCSEN